VGTVGEASSGPPRWAPLLLTGAAAGLFAALFGVGGGIVVVPLLVALLGYGTRAATATSLAAIIFTALWAATVHGALGNIDVRAALLVGVPALLGVTAGVEVKRRISSAALTYAFAALMVAVAVVLVLE
jgi:uncharacterized membrane protein YfcA